MGLMNWFLPSRRSLARAQIEGSLKAWKGHGFFDGDPAASAKAVEDFSAPRLPKAMMDSMNPTLLTDFEPLAEAVSTFASRAAEKLRKQSSVAGLVHVFAHTSLIMCPILQWSAEASAKLNSIS